MAWLADLLTDLVRLLLVELPACGFREIVGLREISNQLRLLVICMRVFKVILLTNRLNALLVALMSEGACLSEFALACVVGKVPTA